ncbi:MAG: hypothetical protein ACK56F_17270 [bacterium]
MLGDCPPLPNFLTVLIVRHLVARRQLQTHTRVRHLVRPDYWSTQSAARCWTRRL